MKLNPQQAPLHGECVLTVQLDDDDMCHSGGEEEEVEFYLLFSGSTQRHLTSTLRVSHVMLQAMCPAHNLCEQVLVTLCSAQPGGAVDLQSQETFCFVQELSHFLLVNTVPQEAPPTDDKQIPLKEFERLDQSLAVALKHLTLSHQRPAPGAPSHTQTDVDKQMAVSQCQQLSSLLQLTASQSVRTVGSFCGEAPKKPIAQGLTPACSGESTGHQQPVELCMQDEASSCVQVELQEQLHFNPKGRVFQQHANLGTYTLTFPGLHQREGATETRSRLQEEVKELRRLIHLDRHKKRSSDFACTFAPTHGSTSPSIDHVPVSPACGLQTLPNSHPDSRQDAVLTVVTEENCNTTTKEQASPSLFEKRTQVEDFAAATHTSCTSGSLCQSQEARGEQRGAPAANSPAGRNRKNKKRASKTSRHAKESPANSRITSEASKETAPRPRRTTGSKTETDEITSPREPQPASVIVDRGATNSQCSPSQEETPSPIKPVFAPGSDGKYSDRKSVALPTTITVEKQEGEKWEVDPLICEQVAETETVTETEQGHADSFLEKEATCNLALGSAAERTVIMGQEQSKDPHEHQSDSEEQSQPDTMSKSPPSRRRASPESPNTDRKLLRGLWQDGGLSGSRSSPNGPEIVAKTVWYQVENVDQNDSRDLNRKELKSQSVWYDCEDLDHKKHDQLKQEISEQKECDFSSLQASGLSSPQLLEQGLSFHQLSAALSQTHAAGTPPARSHGPGTQRQEEHRSQQEEEVTPDWREGGAQGDRDDVSNRESTNSKKSFETASIDEGGEERQGSEEKGAKGRKKKRKKKGKRGVAEAKLSSSSSTESQSQTEIQAQRERATDLNTQSESKSEDGDNTGGANVQPPRASELSQRGEAAEDTMHLPSQTKTVHGPDCDGTNPDPSCSTPELSLLDYKRADLTEVTAPQTSETKELSEDESMNSHGPGNSDHTATTSELSEVDVREAGTGEITSPQPKGKDVLSTSELECKELPNPEQLTVNNVESMAFSKNEDLTVVGKAAVCVDPPGFVESNHPKELPVKLSDSRAFTVDSFLMEFPEQNTQHVQSMDTDKAVQLVDPSGRPAGLMESIHHAEARHLPVEGTVDVSPLQKGEGRAETTQREYLEHCLAAEKLRDRQQQDEERNELWVGEEEVVKERNWEKRSEKYAIGMVHSRELSSTDRGKEVKDEKFPSLDRKKEQNYNEDLVATAVAVVTVAIASAMSSIELSQRLADDQVESQECASKEAAQDQTLEWDVNVQTDTLDQLADNLANTVQSTQVSTQLIDKEDCQLSAVILAETENQPTEHSQIEPTDHFSVKEQARAETSKQLQSRTETEMLPAPQLSINQQTNSDPSALADFSNSPHEREEIQTESQTQNKLSTICSQLKEDTLLQLNMNPLSEANEIITTKLDSKGDMQTESQMKEAKPLSCLVVDTGQNPEASDTVCPASKDTPGQDEEKAFQNQSTCQKDSGIQAHSGEQHLVPHSQHSQTLDKDDSPPVEPIGAAGEVGGEVHACQAEEDESCEDGFTAMLGSDCQAGEHESEQCVDVQVKAQRHGETDTVPFSPVADPSSEKPSTAVNAETGEYQSTETLANMKLVPVIPFDAGSGIFQSRCQEYVAVDEESLVFEKPDKDTDTQDTVDGWKERERIKTRKEEQARKEMVAVEDTCPTETGTFLAAKEENQQTRRDLDKKNTEQIKREKDVFYPVQLCPESNSVTTCTDIHPDKEECMSVCLLNTEKDRLKVGAEGDNSIFKKPEDSAPCSGHKDRGVRVSCSSTDDDALIHRGFSTSEGVLSEAGTPEAVAPQNSRLFWKSEMEDRGGGEAERGGEEEEKKDKLPENPVSSAILRASIRSLSPFRRHSWEPGRNNAAAESDMTQRSSLKALPGEVKRAKPPLHRRSMSWCPSSLRHPDQEQIDNRSYSLEGLEVVKGAVQAQCPSLSDQRERATGRSFYLESQERGSLVSLTEEEQEGDGSSINSQTSHQVLSVTASCPAMFHHQTLTKSISMVAISHQDIDGLSSFSSNSGSLEYSISEEEPGPLRSDSEGKGGPKISRTFSYLRSKMSKKGKEKEKEKRGEKERESKERERKNANGHSFIPVSLSPSTACQHCNRLLHNKETFLCNNCGVHVHKCCRESLSVCTKSKTKQHFLVPEAVPGSVFNMRSKSTSSASSVSSTSSSSSRERWSTATTPEDQLPVVFPWRHPSTFNPHGNLSKSISISNIAGLDDVPLKGLKFLSQSTDSLHQGSKVNASTESLIDEGTEMMDSQLMGEFECDIKDLEADSWSGTVDKKFLKALKKDEIKRQDVIYELYQTEFHHVRTLKIMSEVYYKGLQKELQLDTQTLDKIFPVLEELLDMHVHFFTLLLERKRASSTEGQNNSSFFICSIGDVLVNQFSGCSAESMKKVYGKFCSRHNEAVNLYKDLHAKDKRFQAFIKTTMSSSIVRRLSIPECILLVTQRITKYPVLIQRILQHTKDSDEDHSCVCKALHCVKELITAVDSKVNEQEKKQRLREVYSRTDSKSIMRMKSGQMFAKEDLIRGRKLLHDGALQLKNSAGRLKDVHAMLLSDVLVFLQEKDQKYVFASLDQRSTVISLQNLIVREVANEERGLFLITAGIEKPEMVEVLASSKEDRNTWRAIIQDAMHSMEKDEDEGVPSETEEDRRQHESRAKEIRELLRRKDEQIISLLEDKVRIFSDLGDCNPIHNDTNPAVRERMLFRATPDDVTKGEPIMKDALREVETLHALVNSGVGGAGCSIPVGLVGGGVGPVCLPRRAETFGGFDSHQMNSSKNGEKEEGDESLDLRRTESDSVLKKGATASLQMLLKKSNEQVQHSVTHLHSLLISLQAVVIQQDSFIEDQRQALSDRLTANSSRHSSSSSLSSSSSSRPSSLIEQEKHRSLERQRQEAASLQKQQAAHLEEKRRREKVWEMKDKSLTEREEMLKVDEEETRKRRQQLTEEQEILQKRKEEYQRELERLKDAQHRLERDKEALRIDTEKLDAMKRDTQFQRYQRSPSTTSEDSIRFHSSGSLDLDSKQAAEQPKEQVEMSSSAPTKEPFLRIGSKRMGKNFNPFSSSSKPQAAEKECQLPTRLLQLAKPKEKKDKKKKKGKGGEQTQTESKVMSDPQNDGDIFFC